MKAVYTQLHCFMEYVEKPVWSANRLLGALCIRFLPCLVRICAWIMIVSMWDGLIGFLIFFFDFFFLRTKGLEPRGLFNLCRRESRESIVLLTL